MNDLLEALDNLAHAKTYEHTETVTLVRFTPRYRPNEVITFAEAKKRNLLVMGTATGYVYVQNESSCIGTFIGHGDFVELDPETGEPQGVMHLAEFERVVRTEVADA